MRRRAASSVGYAVYARPVPIEERRDLVVARSAARAARRSCCRRGRGVRGLSSSWCQTNSAAPSAPPASPAAGWIQISSNGPSRRMRPLPTQLSATPPARHRCLHAGHARARDGPPCSMIVFGDLLDRRREVHLALGDRRLRRARRTAEQRVELARRHRQPLAVVEVRHVHPERAVVLEVDELLEDQRRRSCGSPYGARPISLYSPELTLKPQK